MTRPFHKMHGLGNDFVIFDAREAPFEMHGRLARALSDRRNGIGCDQLIVLEPSDVANARMRIWNADGSEVESCGNASRCVAMLIGGTARIETLGGIITVTAQDGGISVDMGRPRFGWQDIPLAYAMDTAAMPVGWDGLQSPFAVNVGNPHIVFFVEDSGATDLGRLGPLIEQDPLFPERVNINVASMENGAIRLHVWERGVGLTQACGTGACAAAVAALSRKLASNPVEVRLPGGNLSISWSPDSPVVMTGAATHVFEGRVDLEAFA